MPGMSSMVSKERGKACLRARISQTAAVVGGHYCIQADLPGHGGLQHWHEGS